MIALKWVGILLAAAAYLGGLAQWIYRARILPGLLAMVVVFPALIWLTLSTPLMFLRALPLVGLGMFVHRYGLKAILEIRMLWFTTLSVLTVNVYYLFAARLYGP
jgi:hypothetical protein